MVSLINLLGTLVTAWKVATKRFGPVGGLVVAVGLVTASASIRPRLAEKIPVATERTG